MSLIALTRTIIYNARSFRKAPQISHMEGMNHESFKEKDNHIRPKKMKTLKPTNQKELVPQQTHDLFQPITQGNQKEIEQEWFLGELMKNSKKSQMKIGLTKKKEEADQQVNQLLREEKIKEAISKGHDPQKSKFQTTRKQFMERKYSKDLIAKAMEYQQNELGYFKELVQSSSMRKRQNPREYRKDRDRRLITKEEPMPQLARNERLQQEGLVQVRDQKMLKERGIQQFEESENVKSRYGDVIKSGEEDLSRSVELGDILQDKHFEDTREEKNAKKGLAVLIRDKFIKDINAKLDKAGIQGDEAEIISMGKELLYEEKKLREQQLEYQKYLQKKEKKKRMNAQLKEIHLMKLRDDLDWNKQVEIPDPKKYSELELKEKFKAYEEYQRAKQLSIDTDEQRRSAIHFKKTFQRMQQFVKGYVYNGYFNPNGNLHKEIKIMEIIPNKKNTVLNVFWKLQGNREESKQMVEKIKIRLEKISGHIGGKMVQTMGLRYAPQIRFIHQVVTKETEELTLEMKKYKKIILDKMMTQYREKGVVTEGNEKIYRKKLEDMTKLGINKINNRAYMLTRKGKREIQGKQQSQPKNKKSPTQKLWQTIETL